MGTITGKYENKNFSYGSWDDVLYDSDSGGYKVKASAARRGITLANATQAFGALPKEYEGKVSGYNPNLVNTNPNLAKSLGLTITPSKPATSTNSLNNTSNGSNYSLQSTSGAGGYTTPQAQAAYNAMLNAVAFPGASVEQRQLIARAAADKVEAQYKVAGQLQGPTPSGQTYDSYVKAGGQRDDVMPTAPTVTTTPTAPALTGDAALFQDKASLQALIAKYKDNPSMAPAVKEYTARLDQIEATLGYADAKARYIGDPKALAAFEKAWADGQTQVNGSKTTLPNGVVTVVDPTRSAMENLRVAISQGDRWVDMYDPLRFLIEPLDNLVNGNPLAAAVAQNGVGVAAGAAAGGGVAAHLGSGMPATPPPSEAGFLPNSGGSVGTAASNANLPQVQMPTNAGGFTPGGGNLGVPPSNSVGYTPINLTGSQPTPGVSVGTTPVATAAGAALGATGTNPASTGTTNIPTITTSGTTPPGGATTPTTDTPSTGNWWDAIGAKEALAAAGIAIGAGGALISANTAANGQTEAARIQAEASQKAIDAQKALYDQTRADQQPWREAGQGALDHLSNWDTENPAFSFNTDPAKGVVDPSYSWRLSEGIKALESSAAGRGTLKSGNTLKAITEYGQGAASQEYNNAYNRHMTTSGQDLNRLQSLAGIGQTAVNTTGQAGQNYVNNATNALIGGSQAVAQGQAGAANTWAQGGMGAVNSLINGLSEYYQNNQREGILNALKY